MFDPITPIPYLSLSGLAPRSPPAHTPITPSLCLTISPLSLSLSLRPGPSIPLLLTPTPHTPLSLSLFDPVAPYLSLSLSGLAPRSPSRKGNHDHLPPIATTNEYLRELKALRALAPHPNIVNLKGAVLTPLR